jgi:proteasome component ECM29
VSLLAVAARAASLTTGNSLREWVHECISEIQDCFLFLLADGKSSQLSRESCCLGLVALNRLADDSGETLKTRLLRSFGQTTNHGCSAMQETREQAESRRNEDGMTVAENSSSGGPSVDVGGAAGVSEASLGAYVEMASAAVTCGHPEILYSMLMLSVSHPVWSGTALRRDRYGPSALQDETFDRKKVKVALRPHLSRLLPRILRACHDPNKETREQMQTLWNALTGGGEEGRGAINSYFRQTFDALIQESNSKLWRTRVGACGALAQIIVGRSWQELGGGSAVLDENYDLIISQTPSHSTLAGVRLLRLWRASLRALDDVRIAVRESGETLGRGARALTVRLCNPSQEKKDELDVSEAELERDAAAAAATSLRFLLKTGLKQHCPEAAGICISSLIGIIDATLKPAILEPLLSDVIFALLVAMSNMEPAAFNYLAVRQDSGSSTYEDLARLRLQASQSTILAEAVRKCIDLVPALSNARYQEAVVGAIESAMRKSTGIATRSACADCVITLCHSTPNIFKSNSSSNSLLRCFFDSVFRERGGKVVQEKMNSAFGSLSALCSSADVKKLAISAAEKYRQAHGSHSDPAARHSAALILRAIAVKAHHHISEQLHVWCTNILPVSYLAMKEPKSDDASIWKEVWEEGGAVAALALDDSDETTIEGKLLVSLVKECVNGLGDLAFVRRVSAAEVLCDLTNRGILAPPAQQLDGRASPEIQRRAQRRAKASSLGLSSLVQLIAKSRVWSGKGEVIKAASVLAIPWTTFIEKEAALGLQGDAASAPIAFDGSSNNLNLFMGDRWFEKAENLRVEETVTGAEVEKQMEQSSTNSDSQVCVVGLCRLFLVQSFPSKAALQSIVDEEVLPFRSKVLHAFESLVKALAATNMKKSIFSFSAPQLVEVVGDLNTRESPLIVARSLSCFAATFWSNMSFEGSGPEDHSDSARLLPIFVYHVDYGKQSAWTVREAAAKAAAQCAFCADSATLRSRQFVSKLIDIAALGVKDKKFWKVRLASLQILLSLTTQEKELILPYKENIQDLAKKSLQDPEAQITALSTKVLGVLALWP